MHLAELLPCLLWNPADRQTRESAPPLRVRTNDRVLSLDVSRSRIRKRKRTGKRKALESAGRRHPSGLGARLVVSWTIVACITEATV
jgi:hypothetical protein